MGSIINALAVAAGGFIGIIIRRGLKEELQDALLKALGLAVLFIGISGALQGMLYVDGGELKTRGTMLLIFSLVLGSLAGEILNIEGRLENLGEAVRKKLNVSGGSFVDGFVTTSLVVCVGAMAVVGSIEDGLRGDMSTLLAKSMLDMVSSMVFASTMGIGVVFAAVPLLLYQGSITLLARTIEPWLSPELIGNISYVGSAMIFTVGINMIFGKKFKAGNMLPALLVPILYEIFLKIL